MDPNTTNPSTPPQPVATPVAPQSVPPQPMAQQSMPPQPMGSQPVAPPERNRGLEMVMPINRSGWALAAGYVALFSIPFVFLAPVAVILGIIGLLDLKKNPSRAGRGRCWFAVIYGGLTIVLSAIVLILSAMN